MYSVFIIEIHLQNIYNSKLQHGVVELSYTVTNQPHTCNGITNNTRG